MRWGKDARARARAKHIPLWRIFLAYHLGSKRPGRGTALIRERLGITVVVDPDGTILTVGHAEGSWTKHARRRVKLRRVPAWRIFLARHFGRRKVGRDGAVVRKLFGVRVVLARDGAILTVSCAKKRRSPRV